MMLFMALLASVLLFPHDILAHGAKIGSNTKVGTSTSCNYPSTTVITTEWKALFETR